MSSALRLAVCILALAPSVAADPLFVEGHVRNLRTGMPLLGAGVTLTDPLSVPIGFPPGSPLEIVGKPDITDGSGFYSIELSEEELGRGRVEISATCKTPAGVRSTDRLTRRVVLRPGTIRRDLYLDAFRSRRLRSCSIELPQ